MKIPAFLGKGPDAVLNFNRQVIEATKDECIAYKLNTAFYESMGGKGWDVMNKTLEFIPDDIFKIADAKTLTTIFKIIAKDEKPPIYMRVWKMVENASSPKVALNQSPNSSKFI